MGLESRSAETPDTKTEEETKHRKESEVQRTPGARHVCCNVDQEYRDFDFNVMEEVRRCRNHSCLLDVS